MTTLTPSQIRDIDLNHTWHPYSSATNPIPCYQVDSAEGVYLQLQDGRRLIDGMSSWWAVIHGYNHPVINKAMNQQIAKMSHVMFGGICHQPAAQLIQTLVEITPASLQRVFLADSGSVSVEVAIKMAIQYWQSRGFPQKSRLLSLRRGYHGDTFGAMAVCDPETGMHHLFKDAMPEQLFVTAPQCGFYQEWDPADLAEFESAIANNHEQLAAVILEPIVQGAGGMRFYHPEYLKGIRECCDRYDVLLIADEIATGFGRTGKLFACEWAGIDPDIMCVGKALTGGYLTMAATLCSDKVALGISEGEAGVFMHGPTFMANPLACATANASLELLLSSDWQQNIQRIESHLKQALEPCAKLNQVADVRVLGAIGVVEMREPVNVADIQAMFVDAGIWIRPFGKLVYMMPPFVISDEELTNLCDAFFHVISNYRQE